MLHVPTAQEIETQPLGLTQFCLSEQASSFAAFENAATHWRQAPSLLTALTEPEELTGTWQRVGQATSILTERQISSLDRLYALRRPEEVIGFLSQHPFLLALLEEAYGEIETCFPTYRQLSLEVLTDPEAIDDRELVLFIQTDLPPAEALESLHRLDRHWWLEASRASRGKLCIHVE